MARPSFAHGGTVFRPSKTEAGFRFSVVVCVVCRHMCHRRRLMYALERGWLSLSTNLACSFTLYFWFSFFFSLSLSPPFLSPCGALNRFYKSLWRFVESFRPRGFASTATLWGGARRSVGVELWETFGDAFIGAS